MGPLSETVRIGASYRSAVGHTVNGDLNATVNKPVNDQVTTPATVSMDAPAWAMLSAAWDVNDWLSLYGTMRWANLVELQVPDD